MVSRTAETRSRALDRTVAKQKAPSGITPEGAWFESESDPSRRVGNDDDDNDRKDERAERGEADVAAPMWARQAPVALSKATSATPRIAPC